MQLVLEKNLQVLQKNQSLPHLEVKVLLPKKQNQKVKVKLEVKAKVKIQLKIVAKVIIEGCPHLIANRHRGYG